MALLYKHPCAIFALALTCAVVFAHGSWRYGFTDVVAWGSVAAVLSVALFPAQRKNQPHVHAQRDVLRGLCKDPLLYLGFALLLLMATQALNHGREMEYDVPGARWVFGAPPLRRLPGSLNPGAAWRVFFTFLPAVAVAACLCHGVALAGRVAYLGLLAVLSGGVAVWEAGVCAWFGGETDGWRVFSNADHGGIWFLLCLVVSIVLWGHACVSGRPGGVQFVYLSCALLNVAGMAAYRAPVALLLAGFAGVPLALATVAAAWKTLGPARRAVALAVFAVVLPLAVCMAGLGLVRNAKPEGEPVPWAQMIFKEGRELRMEVVWKMAKDHPVYGVGGGNYPYFSRVYWPAPNIREYSTMGVAVDNDYAQTLAELGGAGCVLLLAMLVLAGVSRRPWKGLPPACKCLHVLYIAGMGAVFAAAWVESPFRSPPVLVSMAAALACAPGFLTHPQTGEDTA